MTKERRQFNGAKLVFSTNGARTSGHPSAKKKINLDRDLTSFTKQLQIDHRHKYKTQNYKLLARSIAENLDDLGYGVQIQHQRHDPWKNAVTILKGEQLILVILRHRIRL